MSPRVLVLAGPTAYMRPRWVLSPQEVAVLDCNAESLGVNMDKLMITAAGHLAEALQKAPEPIWILCGPGNNGGDGFRLAEMLDSCSVIATHESRRPNCLKELEMIAQNTYIFLMIFLENNRLQLLIVC